MRLAWFMERTGHCCSFSGRFGHGSSRMFERARHTNTRAWKRPRVSIQQKFTTHVDGRAGAPDMTFDTDHTR